MIESLSKKIENLVSVLTDPDFLLIKENLLNILISEHPQIDVGDGYKISIPSHKGALYVINETWGRKISQYEGLKGVDSILDIGGFVGDSALFFLKNGSTRVVACEPNHVHYRYMKKNIVANTGNIKQTNQNFECTPYNVAVITDTSIDRECVGKTGSGINIVQPGKNNRVATVHIESLLGIGPFEGLKMDIEGGEFPIMEWFEQNPSLFDFKKGYIEFHRVYQPHFHQKTLAALDFLENNGYRIVVNDYFGKEIGKDKIIEQKKYPVVMVYFEKI